MKFFTKLNIYLVAIGLVFTSCSKNDEDPTPDSSDEVPTTYSFENVNYSGQTTRINMLSEMESEMKKGNTSGTVVDAQKLKDMYANTNSPFSDPSLNAATDKQLKNKTFSLDQAIFEEYLDKLSVASTSTTPGSNGTAGVVSTTAGTSSYLFDENGYEYTQIILKGLMGAVFYYQVTGNYLTEDKIGATVDNTTVKPGDGTPMEHHWDEAFGYYGVPKDFPTNKEGTKYIGNYSDKVSPATGSNEKIMNAYLKGRTAISNKDMATKDEQADILIKEWENLIAASAILELNKAKSSFADDASRNHLLSEAIGFIIALKYNPDKRITQAQIDSILGHIGSNLYEITVAHIDMAIDEISTIYEMDAIKTKL